MTGSRLRKKWMPALLLLVPILTSLACGGVPGFSPEGEDVLTITQDIEYGPGAVEYTDTSAGLADLTSYKARLDVTFDGTNAGQPEQWSKSYVMLATREPQAREWTITKTSQGSELAPIFMAEIDDTDYERRGENPCNATLMQAGYELSDRMQLAKYLIGVIGADDAGTETVNGVPANHYTFDQRALGQDGLTESSGEMWVATDGGYLVKYVLTTAGGADYFGEGLEGTLSLNYELTDANLPVEMELPGDCPPGLVDAPLLPDAANVAKSPGLLTYETAASPEEVVAFYLQQLPEQGWAVFGEPNLEEPLDLLAFTQANRTLTIAMTSEGDVTSVRLVLSRPQN